MLEIATPPDMRVLLKDELFRAMMQRNFKLPANLTVPGLSKPFHVWVLTADYKWQRGRRDTYAEAYRLMREKLKDEHVLDVSITSIRYLAGPPVNYRWQSLKYPWCPRCRRPSQFTLAYDHRAIPVDAVVTYDDPMRCFYCGIRQAAFPRYSPRKL